MAERLYGFQAGDVRRIGDAVRRVEALPRGNPTPARPQQAVVRPDLVQVVRVTSLTLTDDLNPAVVQLYDAASPPGVTDSVDCWAFDARGGVLAATEYLGRALAVRAADGRLIYAVCLDAGTTTTTYGPTTTISANTDNLDLTAAWEPALPLDVTGAYTLTGLVPPAGAGTTGGYLTATLINVGSGTLTLANESGSSTAANRFTLPSAADITIPPDGSQPIYYDPVTTRWFLGSPPASSSSGGTTGTNGRSTLSPAYTLTNAYANTGLSVSVPSAGTYLIWFWTEAQVDAGSCRVRWDDGITSGPDVTLPGVTWGGTNYRTGMFQDIYTAAGAATLTLQAEYGGGASSGTVNTPTRMGYVRLA